MANQLILLAVATFCLAILINAEHSIDQCADPTQANTLLCTKDLSDSGEFLQIQHETINCPDGGVNTNRITCIKVTNEGGDDGGDAEIVSGGVGYYAVEISLTSQVSKGLNYHIEIYT